MIQNRRQWYKDLGIDPAGEVHEGALTEDQLLQWRKSWGFGFPIDPSESDPLRLMAVGRSGGLLSAGVIRELGRFKESLEQETPDAGWDHKLVAVLDLRIKVETQIQWFQEFSLREQRIRGTESSRPQSPRDKSRWRWYLRHLDAQHEGLSGVEMAEFFYPPDEVQMHQDFDSVDKVKETLRQARGLAKPEGYLRFLGLPVG